MDRRRLLFKLMLWSLGAAALAGVLAMLTATYDVAARIAGTALLTSFAAAVLWKLDPALDEPSSSSGGVLGVVLTIVCYLLVLPAIWDIGPEGDLLLTALGTAVCGGIVVACLQVLSRPGIQTAATLGLAAGGLVWVLWMISTWLVDGPSDDEWWLTTLSVGIYSALAAVSLVDFEVSTRSLWRAVGAMCAALACGLCIHNIWSSGVDHLNLITVFTSVAAVVVHANLALQVPLQERQTWILFGTIAGAIVTALGIDAIVVGELDDEDFLTRIAGAAAIVTGCGTLALLVLARLNHEPVELPALASLKEITLTCPRCRRKQTVLLGESVCPRCQTRISVTLSG